MITIRATTFAKRKNSTAVPGYFEDSYEVALKDSCSYDSPVFLLNERSFMHNYVEWSGWFYFVSDVVVQHNNLLEVHCTLDPLGTYRDAIRNSTQFVAYDTEPNTELTDDRLSTLTTTRYELSSGSSWNYLGGGSCVLLNVLGAEGTGGDQNGISTYALSVDNARTLFERVKQYIKNVLPDDSTPVSTLEDIMNAFRIVARDTARQALTYANAFDNVKSAIIFPADVSKVYGWADSELWLGEYRVYVPCRRAQIGAYDHQTVTIPWTTTDWRRNAPFTEILLYLPYVGVVSIPPSSVMGSTQLTVEYAMTYADGGCNVKVSRGAYDPLSPTSNIIFKTAAQLGAPYAIGSASSQGAAAAGSGVMAVLGGVAGAAAAAATGGASLAIMAGAAGGSAAGIVGIRNAISGIGTSIGSAAGGLLESTQDVQCCVIYHDTNVQPDSVSHIIGTPAMAVKNLSGLSGYVECKAAHVAVDAHDSVMQEIDNYLNSGVYLE